MNINSKSDLSPDGFMKILYFILDALSADSKGFMKEVFKNCLKLLCSMLRDNQILSIQEWPVACSGGIETC
jgi:fused-like protein